MAAALVSVLAYVTTHWPLDAEIQPNVQNRIQVSNSIVANESICLLRLLDSISIQVVHSLFGWLSSYLLGVSVILIPTKLSRGIWTGLFCMPFRVRSGIMTNFQPLWLFYPAAPAAANNLLGRSTLFI